MTDALPNRFGAEVLDRHRDADSTQRLTDIVDGFWNARPATPNFLKDALFQDPKTGEEAAHRAYEALRVHYSRFTDHAANANHAQLGAIVTGWVGLQHGYATYVKRQIAAGKPSQLETIELYDNELHEGETTRAEYEALSLKTGVQLTDDDLARMPRLRKRIRELDRLREEKNGIAKAVGGIQSVERDMQTVIDAPGDGAVHYRIQSLSEIRTGLGNETYKGPEFTPFRITNAISIADIYNRGRTVEAVRTKTERAGDHVYDMTDLPDLLRNALTLRNWLAGQALGNAYRSGSIKDALGEEFGLSARAIGGLLEETPEAFGLTATRVGSSRVFTRQQSGRSFTDSEFLDTVIEKLGSVEASEVNGFYMEKAIGLMREDPRAYEGFTVGELVELVEQARLPLSHKAVGINIHRDSEPNKDYYKLRLIDGEKAERRYVFRDVNPTEKQMTYARAAIPELGYGQVGPQELVDQVKATNDVRLAAPVAEQLLNTLAVQEFKMVRIGRNGHNYRRKDRPKGAAELAATRQEPDELV